MTFRSAVAVLLVAIVMAAGCGADSADPTVTGAEGAEEGVPITEPSVAPATTKQPTATTDSTRATAPEPSAPASGEACLDMPEPRQNLDPPVAAIYRSVTAIAKDALGLRDAIDLHEDFSAGWTSREGPAEAIASIREDLDQLEVEMRSLADRWDVGFEPGPGFGDANRANQNIRPLPFPNMLFDLSMMTTGDLFFDEIVPALDAQETRARALGVWRDGGPMPGVCGWAGTLVELASRAMEGSITIPEGDVSVVLQTDFPIPLRTVRTSLGWEPAVWFTVTDFDGVQWTVDNRNCGQRMVGLRIEGQTDAGDAVPSAKVAFQHSISATELVEMLQAGALDQVEVASTMVSGFDGWQIDGIVVNPDLMPAGNQNGSYVSLFQADPGQHVRYYLADAGDEVFVIVISHEAESFDTLISYVETLVDTMWVDTSASSRSC